MTSYEVEEEGRRREPSNPADISVKLKLMYLRAQEELAGLLVVSTIQK